MKTSNGIKEGESFQTIDPEINSQRGQSSHGPDPPAFSYLLYTCVTASSEVNSHDCHVQFLVCSIIEVLLYRRLFIPLMCNVILLTINSHMERLTSLAYILKATPPARN